MKKSQFKWFYLRTAFVLMMVTGIAGITYPVAANECVTGYVWREAVPGDLVCVKPEIRDQAAEDNAAAGSRLAPPCLPDFVPRSAVRGDKVCVIPDARVLAANENDLNRVRSAFSQCAVISEDPSRCPPAPCKRGFVHRQATPTDYVCVLPEGRIRVSQENAVGPQNKRLNTCIDSYVWRETRPSDHVCVKPPRRERARIDNEIAAHLMVFPPAAPNNGIHVWEETSRGYRQVALYVSGSFSPNKKVSFYAYDETRSRGDRGLVNITNLLADHNGTLPSIYGSYGITRFHQFDCNLSYPRKTSPIIVVDEGSGIVSNGGRTTAPWCGPR